MTDIENQGAKTTAADCASPQKVKGETEHFKEEPARSPAKYVSMEETLASEDLFSDCQNLEEYLSRLKTYD